MEQEERPPTIDVQSEMVEMKGNISRILDYMERQDARQKKLEEKGLVHFHLPDRPVVSKIEAASILIISPRHLQRVRRKLGLKWMKDGRETHYFLKELVEAIQKSQRSWDPVAYADAMCQ